MEPARGDHRPAFEATLDIFQHAGLITKRHKYEESLLNRRRSEGHG